MYETMTAGRRMGIEVVRHGQNLFNFRVSEKTLQYSLYLAGFFEVVTAFSLGSLPLDSSTDFQRFNGDAIAAYLFILIQQIYT